MFCKLSIINDFFLCTKLPIVIFDDNFTTVFEFNYNDKIRSYIDKFEIKNKLKDFNFKPSSFNLLYDDDINFNVITFYNCNKTPMYFLIGPYKTKESNLLNLHNLLTIKNNSIKPIIKLYNHILNSNLTNSIVEPSYSPLITRAIEYVENNYNKQFTIDDLCKSFNINKCYFCNLFKKETGSTFINYLNNYKVEKSKELLGDFSLSLLDVAISVGFNNQSYYSTIFKKYTSLTPMEYRDNMFKLDVSSK